MFEYGWVVFVLKRKNRKVLILLPEEFVSSRVFPIDFLRPKNDAPDEIKQKIKEIVSRVKERNQEMEREVLKSSESALYPYDWKIEASVKCPYCGQEINSLIAFPSSDMYHLRVKVFETHEKFHEEAKRWRSFNCPECGYTITTYLWNAERFLKGEWDGTVRNDSST